jgi:hypothetical protein
VQLVGPLHADDDLQPTELDITTPGRAAPVTAPDSSPDAVPPTATAVRNSPSVCGSPPKRSWLIIGKQCDREREDGRG